MSELTIDLPEGTHLIAALRRSSLDRLGLEPGGQVSVYVKATVLARGP